MLLRVLLILAFFLSAVDAHAGPLVGLAVGLVGTVVGGGGAAAIGTLIVRTAIGLGLSLLMRAIQGQPDKPKPAGAVLQLQMGDDQPMSFPIGKRAVAGRRKYVGTWGKDHNDTPNAFLTDVIEISNLPSYAGPKGLVSAWMDDKLLTILWDEPHPDGRGNPVQEYRDDDGDDALWIKYLDGTQTSADPFLLDRFGNDPDRPYADTRIGRGCQVVIMTARFCDKFSSSAPQGLYEPAPTPMYDLRKDSSIGGNGSHRWGDPSTYEPSTNPAILTYNVIRGIYYNGTEWMFGGQNVAAHRLPADSWIAAANECDRDHLGAPQFQAGIEVTLDTKPTDLIENLRKACAGRLAEVGGMVKLLVGAAGASVYAIDDDSIRIDDEQNFDPFPSLNATHNLVLATYPEPKNKWEPKDAPEDRDLDVEASDGNRTLTVNVKFDAVPFANQVKRLARTMSKEGRRFRTHTLPLPPSAWALEPNDVVSMTSVPSGYDNKKFIVETVTGKTGMLQTAVIRELDPTDYDPPDFDIPTPTGWIGPISAPVQEMTGWTVEPATVKDGDGADRRPAILIKCDPKLADVVGVRVQVRNKQTSDLVFDSDSQPYDAPYQWLLSGNWCLPATEYEARGKYVPGSRRQTNFSGWLDVTTPDTRLALVDLAADIVEALQKLVEWIQQDLPTSIADNAQNILQETQARIEAISQETQERVDGAFEMASRYRAIADELAAVRDYAANIDLGQYQQKEQLRQELKAQIDTSIASFIDQVTTAASSNAALVVRVTTLEANTSNLQAEITAVDLAQSSNYQALSQRMDLQSAGTDNQFDTTKLWGFDTSVESWTGNGAPSVSNGYLRPANHATDPYVVSPDALAVNANISRQVRARIRKTGNPTWEGYAWWMTSADSTWDAARRLSLAAPAFDLNGFALLTWDIAWTGTIDQIRLDLSTAQTTTDYFEFDWIAIGSPSPGASRSDLAVEQQARASGDSANTQQITLMQAQLNDVNGDVQAVSTAVDTLESNVSQLGDDVTSQGEALVSLQQDVAGKASADALSQLSAEVDALGGGGIVSNGQAITALRNSLLPLASEMLDQDFANFLGDMQGKKLTAQATQTLTTSIEQTESSIDILSQAVTLLTVALPCKADGSALDALTVRVNATESGITSIGSSVTSLQNSLTGKADAAALQSLSNTVTQQGNTIGSQSTAITSLQNSLANKPTRRP